MAYNTLLINNFVFLCSLLVSLQAKLVAESTSQLCEAANDVVQGEAQEERLIAAAKAVAATTVQLLHAAQVKADAHSENNKRLQVSGGGGKLTLELLHVKCVEFGPIL